MTLELVSKLLLINSIVPLEDHVCGILKYQLKCYSPSLSAHALSIDPTY